MPNELAMTILGVVRNGGAAFEKTLDCIAALCRRLNKSTCIIGTNDNTDETNEVLARFAHSNPSVDVVYLDGLASSHPDRVDRISCVRNIVLAAMWRQQELPYTLILDMDGPNRHLPIDRLMGILTNQADESWDAIFPNPQPAYYDLYALRHPTWCCNDPWQEIKLARKLSLGLLSRDWLLEKFIHDRQYSIPTTHPRIAVTSAFGGLGLYKTHALRGHWYNPRMNSGKLTCEHVALHRGMIAKSRRLFIDPGLVNNAPPEHLGRTSGRTFPGFASI